MNEINPLTPTPIRDLTGPARPTAVEGGGDFLGSLKDAIAKVNEIQVEAGRAVDQVVTGQSQNVHEMMIALQKADVSFQLMMQIRNKLVAAYEDIQRMQI